MGKPTGVCCSDPSHVILYIGVCFCVVQIHDRTVQYILSAATLPSAGKLSIENMVRDRLPQVSGTAMIATLGFR
jgi:hypothetical protein